ncbi:MAG: biopolymer transporter ExbD [Phycisphaeraceae bacterium]
MSFTAETRERSRPVLPLAAMVDVLFLLLIFFMTVSTFRESELQVPVNLAPAETAEPGAGTAMAIYITITEDERIYLGPQELALAELGPRLAQLAEQLPGENVVIRTDGEARARIQNRVLDLARQAGFEDVSLASAEWVDE